MENDSTNNIIEELDIIKMEEESVEEEPQDELQYWR